MFQRCRVSEVDTMSGCEIKLVPLHHRSVLVLCWDGRDGWEQVWLKKNYHLKLSVRGVILLGKGLSCFGQSKQQAVKARVSDGSVGSGLCLDVLLPQMRRHIATQEAAVADVWVLVRCFHHPFATRP